MKQYYLTRCEMEIMDVVWRRGRVSVQDVVDGLERPLAYTTVMTILGVLASKRKVLRREKEGRAFVYEPIVTRSRVSQSLVLDISEKLFGGSMKNLLLNLIDNDSLTAEDIRELKQAIDAVEDSK